MADLPDILFCLIISQSSERKIFIWDFYSSATISISISILFPISQLHFYSISFSSWYEHFAHKPDADMILLFFISVYRWYRYVILIVGIHTYLS